MTLAYSGSCKKPVVTQSWNWFKANPQRTEILTHLWASIFHNTWRLLNFPKTTYINGDGDSDSEEMMKINIKRNFSALWCLLVFDNKRKKLQNVSWVGEMLADLWYGMINDV
mgnify:CR=1 FL=1